MAKKRGQREGSIWRRRDGRWSAALSLEGRRRYVYGATREKVAERLLELQMAVKSGTLTSTSRITVAEWAHQWLEEKKTSCRPTTWQGYRVAMTKHILPSIGHVRLSGLTPAHIQRLYAKMLEAGLTATSVRNYAARLNACLQRAVALDLLVKNPASVTELPRQVNREMVVLSVEEAEALIRSSLGDRFHALIVLALTTGLRQGEALGLQWSRVDLDSNPATIRIDKTLQPVSGGRFELSEPKTPSAIRQVELPRVAADALRHHKDAQIFEAQRIKGRYNRLNLVFVSEAGTPVHKTNLTRRVFRPLLKAAGLSVMRWHDLRHCAASLLLAKGVPVTIVSKTLGHADVSVTLNTYSHVIPGQQSLAREAMEELFAANAV